MGASHKILPTRNLHGKTSHWGIFANPFVFKKSGGMKQRVRVVGIVGGEEILLLKRVRARNEADLTWELPAGKIKYGEQPEEAMSRALLEFAGVHAKKIELRDAVTLSIPSASGLSNLYIVYNIRLDNAERPSPVGRYSAYRYHKVNNLTGLPLDEATRILLEILGARPNRGVVLAQPAGRATAYAATVMVDGCSRGNPGPAGAGYYIVDADGRLLKEGGEFLGFATSRVAEYYAFKEGCQQAAELGLKSVRFVSDNLMLVNQLNGIYKIKNPDLVPIYEDIQKELEAFDSYSVAHLPRSQTLAADRQANLAVDEHFGKK